MSRNALPICGQSILLFIPGRIRNTESKYRPFGIDVSAKMPLSLVPTEQISILSELELEEGNGIALFPIDDAMTKNKINQLIENNIAVITCNSKIEEILLCRAKPLQRRPHSRPDLMGIYFTGGGIKDVGQALQLLNLNYKMKVICHDLTPDVTALLKNGCVDFVIRQNPELQGYQLVKTWFEYLVKKITPTDNVEIPISIITQDSL